MSDSPIIEVISLDFPWMGLDPFIFTVHHLDRYPAATEEMGPAASLAGRQIGMDFSYRDGWSMYHGDRIPGLPPASTSRVRDRDRGPTGLRGSL